MNINTHTSAMNAYDQPNLGGVNTNKLNEADSLGTASTLERLGSGLRVNKAADDTSAFSIADTLRNNTTPLSSNLRSANDSISLLQTFEGAMNEQTSILQRIRELSVQSDNAVQSDGDREALNTETQQLLEEFSRISDSTSSQGQNLKNGVDMNINGLDISIEGVDSNTIGKTDATSKSLADIDISTKKGAAEAVEIVDKALEEINSTRAQGGTYLTRIDSSIRDITTAQARMVEESPIKDVNFAEESKMFTQHQIMAQAGSMVMSQANALPQNAMRLLQ